MADNNNTIKTTVELDANQAQQEIVKLNAKASDSTKTLQERVDAKNKAVKLQNELSKKTIKNLEAELNKLIKSNASLKDIEKASKKLNAERLKSVKLTENNAKQQSKLTEALKDSKNATKNLDDATGGLLGKLKAFAANPIGLVIIALAGAFKLVSEAIGRSEKASESFGKIGAKLAGVFNGLIAFITPVVELLGETLVFAIEKPGEAWDAFVSTLESGYKFLKGQIIDRFQASFTILSGRIQAGILKMRIAWNNFTGDSEEAEELTKELDKVKESVKEATKVIIEKNQEIVNLANDAIDAVVEYGIKAKESYDKAAEASVKLANAERRLVINRIALEKEQLKSLRLAEEQRQIRDDTSRSIEERIAANTKLGKILDEQAKRELALANQALSIVKQQQAATGSTIDNIQAVGDAELKILEIRERITGQRSEQLVNETGLLKEQSDKVKEFALSEIENQNKIDQLRIDTLKALGENVIAEELKILEKRRLQELENTELTELGKKEIEDRYKLEKLELQKAEEERKAEEDLLKRETLLELEELEIERLKEAGERTLERELAFLEKKRLQDVSAANLSAEQIQLINEKAELAKQRLRKQTEIAEKKKDQAILESNIQGAAEAFGITQEVATARAILNAPEAISNVWTQAAKQPTLPQMFLHGAVGTATTLAPIIKGLADIKKVRFSKSSKRGGSSSSNSGGISSVSSSGGSGAAIATSNIATEVVSELASNNAARLGVDTNLGSAASSDASNNVVGSASNNIVFSESKYNDFQNQVQFKEDKITI